MRKEFVKYKTWKTVKNRCPWAAVVAKAEGGFWAYESREDYRKDYLETDKDRRFAMQIARYGSMTCTEIARELNITRNLVHYWLKQEGIDARACRAAWIQRYLKNMRGMMR